MNDPLHDFMKKHKPSVEAAPRDEYERILERARQEKRKRQHRIWLGVSAASLAAAGMMAFLTFTPRAEPEAWLEADDLSYQPEIQDRGSYQDWLWITDQVVDEAEE
ncbi:MAG TPA: hypothetical protein VFO10_07895 [Oligoflexus sp.]|uniref:hypothetical protein n=1 Tax=Oligoflexus sp. TaxID=1971216 RepID=UPI002D809501|nr:hypothetical protein [Oligoflexus sp.]HET9237157.1 hypothetical protein [Oligoflexus sp.]